MNRRELLKSLAAFAACIRAFEKTPNGAGRIVVRIGHRHSDLCLMRGDAELTRERIPVGRWHFVNDIACCLDMNGGDAAELVERHGIPARGDRHGTLQYSAREDASAVPPKLYAEVIEARALEFAGFIRDTLRRAGAGDVPVRLEGNGAHISGLSQTVNRIV